MADPSIIACKTLVDEVESLRGSVQVDYCDGFLHDTPEKLRQTLNERIAATPGEGTILLAYGRCSNGTAGLVAGAHRLVLPAVDDCIALLLGSRRAYKREFAAHPGTYYYTRGWVEELEDPYREYLKMIPRMGEQKARMVAHLMLESYTRVAIIDTGSYDLAKVRVVRPRRSPSSTACRCTGCPARLRLLEKLVRGPHDGEFLIVRALRGARGESLLGSRRPGARPGDGSERAGVPGCAACALAPATD